MKCMRLMLLAIVLAGTGCGQKGPLVLPDAQHPRKKVKLPGAPKPPAAPASVPSAPTSPGPEPSGPNGSGAEPSAPTGPGPEPSAPTGPASEPAPPQAAPDTTALAGPASFDSAAPG